MAYAKELAETEGLEFVRIERAKILKNQLIDLNGNRLVITGLSEVRNAVEFSFTLDEAQFFKTAIINRGASGEDVEAEIDDFYLMLCSRANMIASGLMGKLHMNALSSFSLIEMESKCRLCRELVEIVNAANRQIDLSAIGGAKTAGQYKVTFSKELSDMKTDFYIVDQSVTGMFERKTRIGL